jgi:hypothetical protein
MRVPDSEEGQRMARHILLVNDDVLGPIEALFIANHHNSNLIHSGVRKIVATPVTVLIKVK